MRFHYLALAPSVLEFVLVHRAFSDLQIMIKVGLFIQIGSANKEIYNHFIFCDQKANQLCESGMLVCFVIELPTNDVTRRVTIRGTLIRHISISHSHLENLQSRIDSSFLRVTYRHFDNHEPATSTRGNYRRNQ